MNEIIHVKFGIIAIAHSSFASATKELASQEFALVNGQTVLAYKFNGHELVISFDNHKVCKIFGGANRINWMVADSFQLNDKFNPPQNIVFEYSNGERDAWDWKNKFDGLIGKKIAFSPSEQYLFLYSEDKREHMFDFVVNIADPSIRYLCFSEA